MRTSGSMQSKLEALESLDAGVTVSRRTLDAGSYVWSITFKDEGNDFALEATDVTLTGALTGSVVTTAAREGRVFGACSGDGLVVPKNGGLVTGQLYYARAFA